MHIGKPKTELGRHLRHRRSQAKLTQPELAAKVGCVPNTISRYEMGLRQPTLKMLKRIAKALGYGLVIELQKPVD